jgi:6-phosphofructokinase 1
MDQKPPTIGIITSGGDAPGMNSCIRAVAREAAANNAMAIGIKNGFDGLINGEYHPLGARDVGGIIQRGGTVLQTRRSEAFREREGQQKAIARMKEAGMDALVVIGGDGSLNGAHALASQGIRVVGVPASIDNDIWGTSMAIGVDTAMNTIMEAVDKLRDTASSHGRAFIVETMGRGCGYLALMAGIVCGAEMVLIPEVPVTVDEVVEVLDAAYRRKKAYAIIVVAEGANIHTNELVKVLHEKRIRFETRVTILGHIQRGGSPTAFDRMLAARMGTKAVEALIAGETDVMTGLQGRNIELVPLEEVISHKHPANLKYYTMARRLAT